MSNEENRDKTEQAKSRILEQANKEITIEKERFKDKMDKARNKARTAAGKARRKNQGHEAVSDQKSHEYH